MSLHDVCVFIPSWFGVVSTIFLGLLTYECTRCADSAVPWSSSFWLGVRKPQTMFRQNHTKPLLGWNWTFVCDHRSYISINNLHVIDLYYIKIYYNIIFFILNYIILYNCTYVASVLDESNIAALLRQKYFERLPSYPFSRWIRISYVFFSVHIHPYVMFQNSKSSRKKAWFTLPTPRLRQPFLTCLKLHLAVHGPQLQVCAMMVVAILPAHLMRSIAGGFEA